MKKTSDNAKIAWQSNEVRKNYTKWREAIDAKCIRRMLVAPIAAITVGAGILFGSSMHDAVNNYFEYESRPAIKTLRRVHKTQGSGAVEKLIMNNPDIYDEALKKPTDSDRERSNLEFFGGVLPVYTGILSILALGSAAALGVGIRRHNLTYVLSGKQTKVRELDNFVRKPSE